MASSGVRLAEVVAMLSLGTDLGLGQPMEHVLRQTRLSLRLADALGMTDHERHDVYYTGLLAWVGCHTDAYEQAKWFGDDLTAKRDGYMYDTGRPTELASYMVHAIGSHRPLAQRAALFAQFPFASRRGQVVDLHNHWRAADALASDLGLGPGLRTCLSESFERWDGRGIGRLPGEQTSLVSRVVVFADVVTVFNSLGGTAAAVDVATARSGTQFDPEISALFCGSPEEFLEEIAIDGNWEAVIAAEPELARVLTEDELDRALEAVADFADLKSPFTLGHSRRTADLAATAASALGWDHARQQIVRRAGLVHDLGRLGVSNTIWDKPGPLTSTETERVRLHPYLTDRMLASVPKLAPLVPVAGQHHERLDGSGYPRGLRAADLTPESRLLAASDTYAASIEPRPHRPARSPDAAAALLRDEALAGRFDGNLVEAVIGAAGLPPRRRPTLPAGLTPRETEVLRLLARGHTNRQIAQTMSISAKTAGSHIEHIYAKTGVRNRAAAAWFATQHGLV